MATDVECQRHLHRARLAVTGMHCSACEGAVRQVLMALPQVVAAEASVLRSVAEVSGLLRQRTLWCLFAQCTSGHSLLWVPRHAPQQATFDSSKMVPAALASALDAAGFPATVTAVEPVSREAQLARFRVEGMTCSSCSSQLESALSAVPGVSHAAVSLTLQTAAVEYDPLLTDPLALARAMLDAGFETSQLDSGSAATLLLEVGPGPGSAGSGGGGGSGEHAANGATSHGGRANGTVGCPGGPTAAKSGSSAADAAAAVAAMLEREDGVVQALVHGTSGRVEVRGPPV